MTAGAADAPSTLLGERGIDALRLARLLIRYRLRFLWNGVRVRGRGRFPTLVVIVGLFTSFSYVGLFAQAFGVICARTDVAGLHGFARDEARRRAGALAERLGLGAAAGAYSVTYSLGMKKRLALAMALIHTPRVLIMDEPTNGLDPKGAREMRATIAELAAEGRTIFLSTHLLDAAEKLCHRVAIIRDGALQAVGAPVELRARFQTTADTTLEELFLRVTEGATES